VTWRRAWLAAGSEPTASTPDGPRFARSWRNDRDSELGPAVRAVPHTVSIVAWIALGLVGGALAGWRWRLRGGELASHAVVGMLGAILGGFMASVLLGLDISGLDGTSVLLATVGAVILIVILHALPPTEVFE